MVGFVGFFLNSKLAPRCPSRPCPAAAVPAPPVASQVLGAAVGAAGAGAGAVGSRGSAFPASSIIPIIIWFLDQGCLLNLAPPALPFRPPASAEGFISCRLGKEIEWKNVGQSPRDSGAGGAGGTAGCWSSPNRLQAAAAMLRCSCPVPMPRRRVRSVVLGCVHLSIPASCCTAAASGASQGGTTLGLGRVLLFQSGFGVVGVLKEHINV